MKSKNFNTLGAIIATYSEYCCGIANLLRAIAIRQRVFFINYLYLCILK